MTTEAPEQVEQGSPEFEAFVDLVSDLSKGNPGALTTLLALQKESEFVFVIAVDVFQRHDIKGTDIAVLASDKCKRDMRKFIGLITAASLEIIEPSRIKELAKDQMRQVNLTQAEEDLIAGILDDQSPGGKFNSTQNAEGAT